MPYITDFERKQYDSALTKIINTLNDRGSDGYYPVGDLNYLISAIIDQTLTRQGVRYQNLNAIEKYLKDNTLIISLKDFYKSNIKKYYN